MFYMYNFAIFIVMSSKPLQGWNFLQRLHHMLVIIITCCTDVIVLSMTTKLLTLLIKFYYKRLITYCGSTSRVFWDSPNVEMLCKLSGLKE